MTQIGRHAPLSGQAGLRRSILCAANLVAGIAFLATATGVSSQGATAITYPTKSIRFVVPFTPGSASDVLARIVGERLSSAWGQPVIVENRPGAGGIIGTGLVAKAEPTGYTLAVVSAGHVVNALLYSGLPYDALRDFAGVIPFGSLPSVLTVAPSLGVNSVLGLVAYAKARPGALNYASGGIGSASHVNAEKFLAVTGIDAVHVPLKGAPEMVAETIAGRTQFGFEPINAALGAIRDGRLVALAVSSPARSLPLPGVPTIAEAGVPGAQFNFWIGLLAPAKTPADVVAKLNSEIRRILESQEVKEKLARLGAEPMPMTPKQFDDFMKDEFTALARVVKPAGAAPN
jgi:tripartite-type tricarboxylate transporter receptor subunit TctC